MKSWPATAEPSSSFSSYIFTLRLTTWGEGEGEGESVDEGMGEGEGECRGD